MSSGKGLANVRTSDLANLLQRIESGRTTCPLTGAGLASAGLGHFAEDLSPLLGMDREVSLYVLRLVMSERRERQTPKLDLVWTGPDPKGGSTRDTAVVVRELFSRARQSVVIAGYSFDNGADILRPLHEVMVERGVKATLFLQIGGDALSDMEVKRVATKEVEAFIAENWPFGEPHPQIYFDPRTPRYRSGASLHAKCLIVDERYVLVGSANFTDRGQTRSIEVGVLIEDSAFASLLSEQWRRLIEKGLVEVVVLDP